MIGGGSSSFIGIVHRIAAYIGESINWSGALLIQTLNAPEHLPLNWS
jgi:hypothetical protein